MEAPQGKRIIAIVGGTGTLGSSVAISLRGGSEFQPRVLSRDPTTSKAQRLARLGIEVLKADNWIRSELLGAFTDCWGVFINLNSDLPNFKQQIGPSEFENGKIVIDAARDAGVKHLIHAALLPATKLTNGAVPVYSFDDKRAVSEYAMDHGSFDTVTLVNAGWFLENAFDPAYRSVFGGLATRDSEGFYTWTCPRMGNIPEFVPWLAAMDDYGDLVHGVFRNPHKWDRRVIHGVSQSLSFADMTTAFQRATGYEARYVEASPQIPDPNKAKEVSGLFTLMHAVKGNFFDGVPTNHETARLLKADGAKARGLRGEDMELMTAEKFFAQYAYMIEDN